MTSTVVGLGTDNAFKIMCSTLLLPGTQLTIGNDVGSSSYQVQSLVYSSKGSSWASRPTKFIPTALAPFMMTVHWLCTLQKQSSSPSELRKHLPSKLKNNAFRSLLRLQLSGYVVRAKEQANLQGQPWFIATCLSECGLSRSNLGGWRRPLICYARMRIIDPTKLRC